MGKSIVLVVGAGASKEAGLPVGSELKAKVAQALDIRYERGSRIRGDGLIEEAFHRLALGPGGKGNINPYLHISRRIRDAMPQATSIDNFIDSHRDDTDIALCGKLAIARCILQAEAASLMTVDPGRANAKP